ncbi:MAG: transcription termination factor NusA [Planctomycetes bacterium]|nr:transcription termination factor NusA [Planctomycetota bacterium]
MKPEQIIQLVDSMHREKKIDRESIFDSIAKALEAAAKKKVGLKKEVSVSVDRETGAIEALIDGEPMSLDEFGRIAAQNFKHIVAQKLKEAESNVVYAEYIGHQGEVISGMVERIEPGKIIVVIGSNNVEAQLPKREQIPGEYYKTNERIRCLIKEVRLDNSKVTIELSRTSPDLVRKLFEMEVPEIHEGIIEIKGIEREPGSRTKVAVSSYDPKVDCVGACVGVRGARIKSIIDELGGEKIDIIRWSESPDSFISNALKPAQITRIIYYTEERRAMAIVPEDQFSLAIGKRGQNVRLASKLAKWEIEVLTERQEKENAVRMRVNMMQIPGCGEELAKALIAFGYETFEDILAGHVETLAKVPGLTDESAQAIYEFLSQTDLAQLKAKGKEEFEKIAIDELQTDAEKEESSLKASLTSGMKDKDKREIQLTDDEKAMRARIFGENPPAEEPAPVQESQDSAEQVPDAVEESPDGREES